MARMTTQLRTFADALTFLDGADTRRLGHNTMVHRVIGFDEIAVRYHATDIIRFQADGCVILDTGGWMTSTTKQRFNAVLLGVHVFSDGPDAWGVTTYRDSARFSDGMWIEADGSLQGWKAARWARRSA